MQTKDETQTHEQAVGGEIPADGDRVNNFEEWERTPADAPTGVDPAEYRVWAFAAQALDPAQTGEEPPGGAKSLSKDLGDGGLCPNWEYITNVEIVLEGSAHCEVAGYICLAARCKSHSKPWHFQAAHWSSLFRHSFLAVRGQSAAGYDTV